MLYVIPKLFTNDALPIKIFKYRNQNLSLADENIHELKLFQLFDKTNIFLLISSSIVIEYHVYVIPDTLI